MSLSSHAHKNADIEDAAKDYGSTAHTVALDFKADWPAAKAALTLAQYNFIQKHNDKIRSELFENGMDFMSEWEAALLEAETCSKKIEIQEANRSLVDKAIYCLDDSLEKRNKFLHRMRKTFTGWNYTCNVDYIEYLQQQFNQDNNNKSKLIKWETELYKLEQWALNCKVFESKKDEEAYFTKNALIHNPNEMLDGLRATYILTKSDFDNRNSCLTKLSLCCSWNKKPKPEVTQSNYIPPRARMIQ